MSTAEAVNFLEQLRPGGPWVLTAIVPDGTTETITAHDASAVIDFVSANDGKRNLYYSVNPLRRAMTKKAAKTDIAAIEYLLGDLDPTDGESPEAAKARYLKALEAYGLPATAAMDSGNGIQGLWRLKEPIILGAEFGPEDQAKIEDVEARAKAIMLALGSKAGTQNIDRILRLPGTTNLPNEKKKKAGRVPCPTKLICFNGASYSLDEFPAPETKAKAEAEPQESKQHTD